ncbi:hypothetical protein DCAR_0730294 [Daucus carota subsp. sativus]|uniref:LOB domain-containing protein n=1 Tax=Daucus carota subsp. sativus TaxID=79200 RepID=A0AAF1BC46_DAUCS|nr:hypothetical protein DCAR_0730294 [Daucus carota subsp. sativus]
MNNKNNNLETREITSNTPTPPPAATNNNIPRCNASQACAACKYQRRKCAPDCILAPYFPHLRQRQFLNAHKLFGVSNITKIIRNLEKYDKDEAMRTIIYQADVRASDPRQIEFNRAELQLVLHQLAYCRAQNEFNNVFDMVNENRDNEMQRYYHEGDDQDRGQYILHGDDQVNFEEINSWGATENSATTLEVKRSYECEENWEEDVNPKLLPYDRREEFKIEAEEKSFDSVDDFRLKTTDAI